MKNQYFGDVNDYRKYALLRALIPDGDLKLLVAWMLTPNDGSNHGMKRAYLSKSEQRFYDSELHDWLSGAVKRRTDKPLDLVEEILPGAVFHSEMVPDDRFDRDAWRENLMDLVPGNDLVFFDPDMGFEGASSRVATGGSRTSQYVAWNEVLRVWKAGCSVLVYQHRPRETHEKLIARLMPQLRSLTTAPSARAFIAGDVAFFLAIQGRHLDRLGRDLPPHWDGFIREWVAPPE